MQLSQADLRVIDRVVELMRPARRLLFITGAGLAADSGLPTYRGVSGLYAAGRTTPYGLPVTRRVDFKIVGGAAEALDRIWQQYRSQ